MPVMNPFGVVAGTLSAGTTKATLGEVVFSNSNGVSFGISGQTITASAAGGGGGNTGSISAGTTQATLGQVIFSNSNGMSFGVNGQTITGSYTVPSTAGLLSNINVSGGTTSNNLSNVVFSNSNNVSFGLNGSTITASASVATSLTAVNISAGTTSNNLSALTFNNGNGVSFGLNGSVVTGSIATSLTNINISAGTTSNNLSAITFANSNGITFGLNASTVTASHNGITSQTNQTVGLYAAGNTTGQSSSSTFDARTISFVGQGIASVGFSNGSVNVSVTQTVQTQGFGNTLGMSNLGNTSGTSGVISGTGLQYLFAGGANITLSQSINGQSATLTISGGAGGAGNTGSISAGTTRGTLGEIVFSNSNGVSFGINGQTVTGSVATSLTNINVSAGTTSNNLSAMVFSNSNGISFGLNGSTVTGSVATSLTAINVSAGTTSNNLSAITFSNSNGLTFGLNASTITGSYTVPGTLSVFAQSNTTQSSSGTIPFNSLQFQGAGIASVGVSNGSVVISVPSGGGAGDGGVFAGVSNLGNTAGSTGTVSTGNFVLVGSNGISLSQSTGAAGSAATVTIYGAVVSNYNQGLAITAAGSNAANSSASIIPFLIDAQLSVSQIRLYASISAATTTLTSSVGFAIGWSGVIYSNNAGTLSSINSFSNSTSTIHQSNSTSSVANVRALTANLASASLFTPGSYWLMINVTTTTSGQTSLAKGVSMGVIPTWASGFGVANYFGNNTTNTRGVLPGLAIHSTGATRATLAFSDITGHSGNSASLANVWFELNNGTIW